MGVWGANRLLQRGRAGRVALAMGGLTLLAAYALVTRQQLRYWRTDLALFKHALAVTADIPVAHSSVGMDFGKEGKIGLAVAHLRKAVALAPQFGNAASSLAVAYEIMGNPDLALEQYQAAVELLPWDDSLRIRLARVLLTLGRRKESLSQYAQATQLNPDNFEGHYQLGLFLSEQG